MGLVYRVPATVVRVIDGDTIVLDLDLGWHITRRESCRIRGVNAPERGTPEGRVATAWAQRELPAGLPVLFTSQELDKYGRPLGDIDYGDRKTYGVELLAAGLAVPYLP